MLTISLIIHAYFNVKTSLLKLMNTTNVIQYQVCFNYVPLQTKYNESTIFH